MALAIVRYWKVHAEYTACTRSKSCYTFPMCRYCPLQGCESLVASRYFPPPCDRLPRGAAFRHHPAKLVSLHLIKQNTMEPSDSGKRYARYEHNYVSVIGIRTRGRKDLNNTALHKSNHTVWQAREEEGEEGTTAARRKNNNNLDAVYASDCNAVSG